MISLGVIQVMLSIAFPKDFFRSTTDIPPRDIPIKGASTLGTRHTCYYIAHIPFTDIFVLVILIHKQIIHESGTNDVFTLASVGPSHHSLTTSCMSALILFYLLGNIFSQYFFGGYIIIIIA